MSNFKKIVVTDKLKYFRPNDTNGLKVVFLSFSCLPSISHWRSISPAKAMAKNCNVHTNVIFEHIRKEVLDWADIVVFQRLIGDMAKKLVTYCNLKNLVTIYDIDDNFYEYPDLEEYANIDKKYTKNSVLDILNDCDCVTTTTSYLKKVLKSNLPHKNIYILPNHIDYEFWSKDIKYNNDEIIRIGYLGGDYHISDLQMVLPVIYKILEKYSNVKFEVIGMLTTLDKYFPDNVVHHKPMAIENLPTFLSENHYDIAIAPLLDNTFSEARSNIRLLQHSLFDTACVFSSVGSYKESYESGFSGVMVNNDFDSWFNAISDLIENKEKRKNISNSAKLWTYKNHNIDTQAIKYVRAYQDIFKKAFQ